MFAFAFSRYQCCSYNGEFVCLFFCSVCVCAIPSIYVFVNEKLQNVTLLNIHQFILAEIDFCITLFASLFYLILLTVFFFQNAWNWHIAPVANNTGSYIHRCPCDMQALTLSIDANPNVQNIDIDNDRDSNKKANLNVSQDVAAATRCRVSLQLYITVIGKERVVASHCRFLR